MRISKQDDGRFAAFMYDGTLIGTYDTMEECWAAATRFFVPKAQRGPSAQQHVVWPSVASPDLPVGGSTGCDHEHSAMVEEAAAFLRSVPPAERPKPLVPALREMFGLSPFECCEAIRLSHEVPA